MTLLATAGCSNTSASGGTTTTSTLAAGAPWVGGFTSVTPPAPVNSLTDVTCPSPSHCWAVGSTVGGAGAPNGAAVIATDDGGMTWSIEVIPPQVGYLSRIACSDDRSCTAVGQATQTTDGQGVTIGTDDGGATWKLEPVPVGVLDVTAVTCRPGGSCVAIGATTGGAIALTSSSPQSGWTAAGALPPGTTGATAISCTEDDCWVTARTAAGADAITGTVALTTDGGTTWATVPTPKGLGSLDGVSCLAGAPSGTGAVPAATAPVGAPTAGAPASTTTSAPAPVVGVAGARCAVVGTTATTLNGVRTGRGVLLTSDNGGATWTSQPVTAASAALMDISCTAIGTCVAVGSAVAASPEAGLIVLTGASIHPWSHPAVDHSPQSLTAVSCVSLSSCVVVGESISQYLNGG